MRPGKRERAAIRERMRLRAEAGIAADGDHVVFAARDHLGQPVQRTGAPRIETMFTKPGYMQPKGKPTVQWQFKRRWASKGRTVKA